MTRVAGALAFLLGAAENGFSGMSSPGLYSHSQDFNAVRFSYTELISGIDRARALIRSANTSAPVPEYEELSLQSKSTRLTLSAEFSMKDLVGAPEVAFDAVYRYQRRDAPISSVTIRLSDSLRQTTVEGASLENVDALLGLISDDLRKHTTLLGGPIFRLATGAVTLMIMWVVGVWGFLRNDRDRRGRLALALAAAGYLAVIFLPWETWLPGVAVYAGDASFLVRHAPEISFVGTFATLVGLVLSLLAATRKREGARAAA